MRSDMKNDLSWGLCLTDVTKYLTDVFSDISLFCLYISIRTIQYYFHYDTLYFKDNLIIGAWTTETPM